MNVPLRTGAWGRVWDPGFSENKCKDLCLRDKPNEKIDVHDCPDILAILSWNMGRPAQLQPEKRSRQGRHLLFLHTKRLEIRGSRQIFCPTLAFAAVFFGVTCAVVRKVYASDFIARGRIQQKGFTSSLYLPAILGDYCVVLSPQQTDLAYHHGASFWLYLRLAITSWWHEKQLVVFCNGVDHARYEYDRQKAAPYGRCGMLTLSDEFYFLQRCSGVATHSLQSLALVLLFMILLVLHHQLLVVCRFWKEARKKVSFPLWLRPYVLLLMEGYRER